MENKKESANLVAKKKIVAEILDLLARAKSVIFVDYKGLTVAEATELRSKFRKSDVVYKVYKNNLVRLALKNFGVGSLDAKLTGTLAMAFAMKDEVAAAKIIINQKFQNKMAFQFGLIGTSVLSQADIVRLSSMPSKETLIAQLLGLLQSGARGIASVVQAVPRNLAVVINARAA